MIPKKINIKVPEIFTSEDRKFIDSVVEKSIESYNKKLKIISEIDSKLNKNKSANLR